MGSTLRFPSLDEAMEWVRQAVDEESRLEADYQRELRELRDALESTPSWYYNDALGENTLGSSSSATDRSSWETRTRSLPASKSAHGLPYRIMRRCNTSLDTSTTN